MSVVIEELPAGAAPDERQHEAAATHDEEEDFHDAAESEDSFVDATEHFDVESLTEAQQRAQHAADAGAAEDVAASRQHNSPDAQPAPEHEDPWQPAKHPSSAAAAADGATASPQEPASAAQRGVFDDDDWQLGQRWREPRAPQPHESDAAARHVEGDAAVAEGEEAEAVAEAQTAPPEEVLSPEQIQERTAAAEALKQQGNALYAEGKNAEAQAKYSEALDAAPPAAPQRAVYFANRAAAALRLEHWSDAAADCTAALAIDGAYVKAYLRRAAAYEHSDDLERALADYKKVLELDAGSSTAAAKARALEPVVQERRDKMKEEMIGKLKELGNTVLGKFGMSIDNFKAVQDPATGAYSINFSQ